MNESEKLIVAVKVTHKPRRLTLKTDISTTYYFRAFNDDSVTLPNGNILAVENTGNPNNEAILFTYNEKDIRDIGRNEIIPQDRLRTNIRLHPNRPPWLVREKGHPLFGGYVEFRTEFITREEYEKRKANKIN